LMITPANDGRDVETNRRIAIKKLCGIFIDSFSSDGLFAIVCGLELVQPGR